MKLKDCKINDVVKIVGYNTTDRQYRQKILAMGLTKGQEMHIKRKAPLGDPIEVTIRGFQLSLRGEEADAVEVERVL